MPPQRRQSLAPTTSTNTSRQVLGRKRAQSMEPSGANQQLVPRKSILKSTPFTFGASVGPSDQQENEPPVQNAQSQIAGQDGQADGIDYAAEISDNTTRKSLGRRVSFAPLASFRIFESNDNTNSSGVPSSSPTPASPPESEASPSPIRPLPPIQLSNENDYPGRRSNTGPIRRVSTATEYGERSMSLDMDQDSDDISEPPTDPVFFQEAANAGSDYEPPPTDEDFHDGTDNDDGEDDEDDEDMEITEAIALNIDRKRSLSVAQQHEMARRSSLSSLASRRRSSIKPPPATENKTTEDGGDEDDKNEEDLTTNTQATQESEAPMEFTIAVGEPLKKPKPPSKSWLALLAMQGGSSNDDNEEAAADDFDDEIELSSALSRLQTARSSLDINDQDQDADGLGAENGFATDDSFTATESSMEESLDVGDQTLNVTSLMGRVSNIELSADSGRDSGTMEDEDFARPIRTETTAPLNIQRKENAPVQAAPSNAFPSSVFSTAPAPSVPAGSENERPAAQRSPSPGARNAPDPSRPPLQSKSVFSSSVFSAPSTTPSRIPRPLSPSKTRVFEVVSPTKKRPAPAHDTATDAPQPSPAKKRLLENSTIVNQPSRNPSPAPAQPEPAERTEPAVPLAAPLPTRPVPRESLGGIRRPPDYFAQRLSLTPGVANVSRLPSPSHSGRPNVSGSKDPRFNASAPAPAHVPNENAPTTNSTIPTSTPLLSPPTVIVTPDDAGEKDAEPDAMNVDSGKQEMTVQRRSLVSSDTQQFAEEFDDVPSISIKEFFLMTGVKFHEYTIPRRSTIHPSQLQGARRDSTIPPSMSDYLTAMIVHVPQLELYRLVTKDLQAFIDNSEKIYREAEDEVGKLTPVLFREFAQANEEGREELLHQLKLIKANRLIAAKDRWYDVRSRWIQGLQENVDRGFSELEKDRDALESIISQAQVLLPALRQQHAQAQAQLERERTDIEEVENSDPNYLEELKIAIEEQNQLLEVYKTDVTEGSAKIERLEGKLEELEAQRLENVQAIEAAERRISYNKSSTRAEVFRLKDELECLQVLHSWRVSRASESLVELMFTDLYLVSIPCTKFRPAIPRITVSRVDRSEELKYAKKRPDPFPLLSDLAVSQGEAFARSLSTKSIKKIVEAMSDFWTSCMQIRTQLTFLGIKYPLTLEPLAPQDDDGTPIGLKAVASILIHKHKTKLLVGFMFNPEVLSSWPFSIRKLQVEVKTAYGKINSEDMRSAVLQRLSEASIENNHACLLDSCVEAAQRFE
ncbi:uncharacterized protein FOMMEDRAFT_155520 [Fomitiporia mediterranea MF3/22]|uniref:uncharacterized protein n=1 Tax=Fomitiporia mediterranea (strain MF3/22) TaxID=694068 RepID=UPI00044096A4|nr:uncharacterized protein FOMMEDRAFT_155520 [Fomitiporia mediterranea MF3/22]EJD04390.1 hypothetical protein FOMMEDRAFT_155520 [Fomitiporia mediterranea MF3/22]